ncbi:MAG: Ldh family oxidoreductase [Phycisphaerae bacterium]
MYQWQDPNLASGVETRTFTAEQLRSFVERVFGTFGVPEEDAAQAADVLIAADLRGINSHGVARLKTYVDMLTLGRINPTPTLKVVRETACTGTVDGDNGLGLVVGPRANRIAMEKAKAAGSGLISVCNTNHYGIAGYYAMMGLPHDLICWSMTNTTKLVAPLWGAQRMTGTNPLAIAFPAGEEPPIVIDMATCAAAYGKIEQARRRGDDIPHGWAIDRQGRETVDPDRMVDGGALLPLGSYKDQGGHKGWCLASMVDICCCVLSGANWGPWAPPFALRQEVPEKSVGKGIGHFFGAARVDGFIDTAEYKEQMDDYIRTMRGTRPQPGTPGVVIPGDPERQAEEVRSVNGIPVLMPVVEDMQEVAKATGASLD